MNILKHRWMKHALLALLTSFLCTGLSGCATFMANEATETTTSMSKKLAYEDAILGMGQPTGDNISEEARHFLALIGQKQTYLLIEGADEIKSIVKNLDGRLIGVNQDQESIEMSVFQDGKDNQRIAGDIRISYNKPTERLTGQERQTLDQLKFKVTQDGQTYERYLSIQALVYPPAKNLQAISAQFKQTRHVTFYQTEYKQNHNPLRAVLLPLGVAFDVITAPIQIPFWIFSLKNMKFM